MHNKNHHENSRKRFGYPKGIQGIKSSYLFFVDLPTAKRRKICSVNIEPAPWALSEPTCCYKHTFNAFFRGRRTQPLICVGRSVHYWVPCAINKGGFFEIAFVVVVDTHLPYFEALAYVLRHFDELTHVVIRASSSAC